MNCRHCKYCQLIKTLSGYKYHCMKHDTKASRKEIGCLGFKKR